MGFLRQSIMCSWNVMRYIEDVSALWIVGRLGMRVSWSHDETPLGVALQSLTTRSDATG